MSASGHTSHRGRGRQIDFPCATRSAWNSRYRARSLGTCDSKYALAASYRSEVRRPSRRPARIVYASITNVGNAAAYSRIESAVSGPTPSRARKNTYPRPGSDAVGLNEDLFRALNGAGNPALDPIMVAFGVAGILAITLLWAVPLWFARRRRDAVDLLVLLAIADVVVFL